MLQINPSFNSKSERVAFTLSPVYDISPYKQSGFSLLLQSCEKEIDIELFAGDPINHLRSDKGMEPSKRSKRLLGTSLGTGLKWPIA